MAENTHIEWTDATWNPWHGCHKVSAGCKNCYMFRDKERYGQDPNVVQRSKTKFYDPLKWKEPKMIFTCSWSDFFIEEADEWRDEAFAIMALTPQHTYQVLTKRPERMLEYFRNVEREAYWMNAVGNLIDKLQKKGNYGSVCPKILRQVEEWIPLKNCWLGVSVEDQKTADERIPLLLNTPAAVRFLSVEPLLMPMNLRPSECFACGGSGNIVGLRTGGQPVSWYHRRPSCPFYDEPMPSINWVIIGTESGPHRRPAKPEGIESIVDQCKAAGVPVFVKQIELNGKVEKDIEKFPANLQFREFPK